MTNEESTGSIRRQVLNEAAEIVDGDRDNQYGSPENNFGRIAGALSALGYRGPDGREIIPSDVAVILIATKIGRLSNTHGKRDTWVDIAGYAACGAEIVQRHEPKRAPERVDEEIMEMVTLAAGRATPRVFATTPAGDIPMEAVVRRVPGGPARGLTPGALYLADSAKSGVWVGRSGQAFRITPSRLWFSINVRPDPTDIISPMAEIDPTKIPFIPNKQCSTPHTRYTLPAAGPHLFTDRDYLWLCPGEVEEEDED
jgi:hypothetical protein